MRFSRCGVVGRIGKRGPGAGVSRSEGAEKRPDWGGASGSQSSARPGILREAACGDRRVWWPRRGLGVQKMKRSFHL